MSAPFISQPIFQRMQVCYVATHSLEALQKEEKNRNYLIALIKEYLHMEIIWTLYSFRQPLGEAEWLSYIKMTPRTWSKETVITNHGSNTNLKGCIFLFLFFSAHTHCIFDIFGCWVVEFTGIQYVEKHLSTCWLFVLNLKLVIQPHFHKSRQTNLLFKMQSDVHEGFGEERGGRGQT